MALFLLFAEVFKLKLDDFVLIELVKHRSSDLIFFLQPKTHYLIVTGVADLSEVDRLVGAALHSFWIHRKSFRDH